MTPPSTTARKRFKSLPFVVPPPGDSAGDVTVDDLLLQEAIRRSRESRRNTRTEDREMTTTDDHEDSSRSETTSEGGTTSVTLRLPPPCKCPYFGESCSQQKYESIRPAEIKIVKTTSNFSSISNFESQVAYQKS